MSIDSGHPEAGQHPSDVPMPSEADLSSGHDDSGLVPDVAWLELAGDADIDVGADGRSPDVESGEPRGPTDAARMVTEGQQDVALTFPAAVAETGDRAPERPVGELPRGPDLDTRTAGESAADSESPTARDVTLQRILPDVCRMRGVDLREGVEAVEKAYGIVYDKVAPFMVHHMADFVDQAKVAVEDNPHRRYAFLGRDGNPMAACAGILAPDLYANHCSPVLVTRRQVEAGLQDEEITVGTTLDIDDEFRKYKNQITVEETWGAKVGIIDQFAEQGLYVEEPGQTITVVDTSLKGSTQVGLTALFPEPEWEGRYLFYRQSPADRHSEAKAGLALDLRLPASNDAALGEGLPEDRDLTFAHPSAILLIEDLLHGPWSSAKGTDAHGRPIQELEPPPTDELNPLDIAPAFESPAVRLAAADMMLYAVRDRAFDAARHRDAGGDWRAVLREQAERFVDDVRSWISTGDTDPGLAEVAASFARPIDRHQIAELRTALAKTDLGTADIEQVWREYQQADSLAEKQSFVTEFTQRQQQPGKG